MKFILNTGRTIEQGSHLERKNSFPYMHAVSLCLINPVDMMVLGIEDNDHILLSKNDASVVVYAKGEEGIDRGTIYLPLGPYANFLLDSETHGTGMPDFKSTVVRVSPTNLDIIPVWKLMAACGGVRYED